MTVHTARWCGASDFSECPLLFSALPARVRHPHLPLGRRYAIKRTALCAFARNTRLAPLDRDGCSCGISVSTTRVSTLSASRRVSKRTSSHDSNIFAAVVCGRPYDRSAESKRARNVETSNARGDRTFGERGNGAQSRSCNERWTGPTIGSCDIFPNCEEHRRMCRECDLTVTAGGRGHLAPP
jgi:hypothetical protein